MFLFINVLVPTLRLLSPEGCLGVCLGQDVGTVSRPERGAAQPFSGRYGRAEAAAPECREPLEREAHDGKKWFVFVSFYCVRFFFIILSLSV